MSNNTTQAKQQAQSEQERANAQAQAGAATLVEPGQQLPNPAEPYATTTVPERANASVFTEGQAAGPSGYPKVKYHPVHGGVNVDTPEQEGGLQPKTDWFDSPELADLARTWTEAEVARTYNQLEKLKTLEGKPVVRNSAQADEAIRRGQTEPL
jgi:hypothetical protein